MDAICVNELALCALNDDTGEAGSDMNGLYRFDYHGVTDLYKEYPTERKNDSSRGVDGKNSDIEQTDGADGFEKDRNKFAEKLDFDV